MAVQIFPAASAYIFGSTVETGIAVETYEQNDQVDIFEQKNNVGEVVEIVTYNPRSEFTITGESTSALANILGKVMTVANLVTTQVATGGVSICKQVGQSKSRAKNLQVRVMGTYWPLVTS